MKSSRWRQALAQACLLAVFSAAAAVATHFFHPQAPAWYLQRAALAEDELVMEQVQNDFGDQVLWLDARPTEQYEAAHLPGAKPLNEQGFDAQLFELIELLQTNEKPIVIYCGGERCEASRKIKQRLLDAFPLENVWVLKGGWRPE
jgi:rhodanese-related sulfurtransferase